MLNDRKPVSGVPIPARTPRGVVLSAEARIARRRLWPATIVYGATSATLLGVCLYRHGPIGCLAWLVAGAALWTWMEYLVHRFVLHGAPRDGFGGWRRVLHHRFDHIHRRHHREPWNGLHASASLLESAPIALAFAVPAALVPQPAGAVVLASFLLSYLAEEWVHLAVHFAPWHGRYLRYVRRRHDYHHGSRVGCFAFGLTIGAWDRVHGTHVPAVWASLESATSGHAVVHRHA
jgi:cyclopropane-fatty-acyl-phospholipid synthase